MSTGTLKIKFDIEKNLNYVTKKLSPKIKFRKLNFLRDGTLILI